jgi:hypothetical protein
VLRLNKLGLIGITPLPGQSLLARQKKARVFAFHALCIFRRFSSLLKENPNKLALVVNQKASHGSARSIPMREAAGGYLVSILRR